MKKLPGRQLRTVYEQEGLDQKATETQPRRPVRWRDGAVIEVPRGPRRERARQIEANLG